MQIVRGFYSFSINFERGVNLKFIKFLAFEMMRCVFNIWSSPCKQTKQRWANIATKET